MTDRKRFTKRINVYVTVEMQSKLEQISDQRGAQMTVPDVVREAVRLYLDDQEQVIGSRRHFQKTLRDEMEAAQRIIIWNQIVLLVTLCHWLNPVVTAVTKQNQSDDDLFTTALSQAAKHRNAYVAALDFGLKQSYKAAQPPSGGQ